MGDKKHEVSVDKFAMGIYPVTFATKANYNSCLHAIPVVVFCFGFSTTDLRNKRISIILE
ncbi:hypothetical protein [Candidatus Marithrix sp. Canyon 246]|uniref:hypothetical protein n=1 Tax=Candidatus Marithrix sp. Canyon 246 TaxID=1827136 RepID=UPI00084A1040|nr:hypothetical protein [Candidatus Marithrix sp. Canyon 246]